MDVDKAHLEKLERFRSMGEQVRIGGKGTARRKRKVVHKNIVVDDKKLQSTMKKLNLNNIPAIEEVNMYRADGMVVHFKNPKVQASPQANVFAVTGQAEVKPLTDLFPNMFSQLENTKNRLSKLNDAVKTETEAKTGEMEDDVPELVGDFDEKSRLE